MSDDFTPFNRAVFIGIGLIGSSLARVMRRDGLAREIIAVARRQETLDTVRRLALADETLSDPAAAVAGADLVIIGTPLGAYEAIGHAIAPALAPGAIVTDVGSTKQSAMRDLGRHLPGHVHFVPGHPLAGTEHSGPESGFETLFEGRWCILTPDPATDRAAVRRISDLWQRAGMMVEEMSAAHHDVVLAITSQLPHLIAYTIVGTADDLE